MIKEKQIKNLKLEHLMESFDFNMENIKIPFETFDEPNLSFNSFLKISFDYLFILTKAIQSENKKINNISKYLLNICNDLNVENYDLENYDLKNYHHKINLLDKGIRATGIISILIDRDKKLLNNKFKMDYLKLVDIVYDKFELIKFNINENINYENMAIK